MPPLILPRRQGGTGAATLEQASITVGGVTKTLAEALASAGGGGSAGGVSTGGAAILDGTTDDTVAFQAEIDRLGVLGGGTIRPLAGKSLYINGVLELSSNITLDFADCPINLGATGAFRTDGKFLETPATSRPRLYADVSSGASTIEIVIAGGNVSPAAGMQYIIRGANAANGRSLYSQQGYVTAVSGPNGTTSYGTRYTLTLDAPLDDPYPILNVGSPYAVYSGNNDYTYISFLVSSAITTDVAAGTIDIPVASVAAFSVGQYVAISDNERAGEAVSITDNNYVHYETSRIVALDTTANTVRLERALEHAYTVSHKANVAVLTPTTGARLRNARINVIGQGDKSQYPIRLNLAVDCEVENTSISPTLQGGTWVGQVGNAFRIDRSYRCRMVECRVQGKPDAVTYTSGLGYGFVLQQSTSCTLSHCTSVGMRHGVLIQAGSAANGVYDHLDINARISGIDFHGINARRNHVARARVIGGPLNTSDARNKAGIRIGNSAHMYGDFDNLVEDCTVMGYGGLPARPSDSLSVTGYGVDIVQRSSGNMVRNCRIVGADYGLNCQQNGTNTQATLSGNVFDGNEIVSAGTTAVKVDGGSGANVFTNLSFLDTVIRSSARAFDVANVGTLRIVRSATTSPVAASGVYAVTAAGITTLSALDNDFSGCNRGISLTNCPGAQVIDNLFNRLVESTVFLDNGGNTAYIFENNSYAGTASPVKTLTGGSTGTITDRGAAGAVVTQPYIRKYIDGLYYYPMPFVAVNSTKTLTAGRIYAIGPFPALETKTLTKLGASVTTAVSGNIVLGLYTDNGNHYPGTLVGQSGVLSSGTVAVIEGTGLTLNVSQGSLYWLTVLSDVAAVLASPGTTNGYRDVTPTFGGNPAHLVKKTLAYTATLPSSFPAYSTAADYVDEALIVLTMRSG